AQFLLDLRAQGVGGLRVPVRTRLGGALLGEGQLGSAPRCEGQLVREALLLFRLDGGIERVLALHLTAERDALRGIERGVEVEDPQPLLEPIVIRLREAGAGLTEAGAELERTACPRGAETQRSGLPGRGMRARIRLRGKQKQAGELAAAERGLAPES